MEFPRQEYWSGLSFPPPGDLPDPGIEPESPALQSDSLPTEPPAKPHQGSLERWVTLAAYQLYQLHTPTFLTLYVPYSPQGA